MASKIIQNVWKRLWLMLTVVVLVSACGEDEKILRQQAVDALTAFYESTQLPPSWVVDRIRFVEDGHLMVEMIVESDYDVAQIKAQSRMLQFFIAKQGCPKPKDDSLRSVAEDYRVWVRLWSPGKKELTRSICPHLYAE